MLIIGQLVTIKNGFRACKKSEDCQLDTFQQSNKVDTVQMMKKMTRNQKMKKMLKKKKYQQRKKLMNRLLSLISAIKFICVPFRF